MNKFSKDAGYRINIQRSVACLHTNSKLAEKEIRSAISFSIAPKTYKVPRNRFNLKGKTLLLQKKKHKMPLKILKMIQANGKTSHTHGSEVISLN